MTRNISVRRNTRKPGRRPRVIRGDSYMDAQGGIEKFRSDRRKARRQWRKEDERYM